MQNPPIFVDKKLSDYNIHWILIITRSFFIIISLLCNLLVRKCICPFVHVIQVDSFLACEEIYRICCQFAHNENYSHYAWIYSVRMRQFQIFHKRVNICSQRPTKITLKSGFIGIGSHKSIIDYLYYSYLVNPVFVKIIVYQKEDKEEIYYAPLSFIQGLQCALNYRGFDPIIIHNQKQFKQLKYRKLAMKTLISECFEQLNGPVFIMLPGMKPHEHVRLNNQVAINIYQNQIKFQRSLIGFCIEVDKRLKLNYQVYKNQLFVLLDLMSSLTINSITINAIQFRKFKNRYDRTTYSTFIDKYYTEHGLQLNNINYQQYITQLNTIDEQSKTMMKSE